MTTGSDLKANKSKTFIDPRLQARRVAVLRSNGRQRLRILVSISTLTATVVVVWVALQSPLFDLDHITIQPLRKSQPLVHIDAKSLGQVPELRRGEPLFNRDLQQARREIQEMAWVDQVEVERDWPGAVVVRISERTAIGALAHESGGWMLVDRQGRGLQLIPALPTGIVVIEGVQPISEPGQVLRNDGRNALKLIKVFPQDLRAKVSKVIADKDGSLLAFVRPDESAQVLEVRFGLSVELSLKVVDLMTLLASAQLDRVTVIDVRVPGSPALLRSP